VKHQTSHLVTNAEDAGCAHRYQTHSGEEEEEENEEEERLTTKGAMSSKVSHNERALT
jgi:hypothetical protein